MANNYLPSLFDFENAMQEQENRMKEQALLTHMENMGYVPQPETNLDIVPSVARDRTQARLYWETVDPSQEFLVLTDSEMKEQIVDHITDCLWAFNADFLQKYMGDHVTEKDIRILQESGLCEGLNNPFMSMVGDNLDKLVKDAVSEDGYGHFLSPYDGEHYEVDGFNIFRQN